MKYPLDLAAHLPLVAAGALVILLPASAARPAQTQGDSAGGPDPCPPCFAQHGQPRHSADGARLGEQQLGAIVILFVLSNLLHLSVGMFIPLGQ